MGGIRRYLLATGILFVAIAIRVYAAEISNVTISDVTQNSATITWNTDINTDATINYGLDSSVGIVRDPLFDKKEHTLTIENLDPSTTYHFRVVSSDESGNKSATAGFVFTTDGSHAEKIISDLDKIKDEKEIKKVVEKVKQVAEDIIRPPAIIGTPKVYPETTHALFTWTTDREANSMVHVVPEAEFHEGDKGTYTTTQGNENEALKTHSIDVVGLDPSTTYHFTVSSEDSNGLRSDSEDDTFKTKSVLPEITGVKLSRVQETSAVVSWDTGSLLAKGTVEYKNLRTNVSKSAGDPIFTSHHSVQLTGLVFGTKYSAVITATNQGGDQVISAPFTFVTVRDVVPPSIAKVKNESTLYPGEDTKVQTILSWETDEPAYCQVFYSQGGPTVPGAEEKSDSLQLEPNPTTAHTQVIVGFAPATVYKFWVVCDDEAHNESRSEDFVLITPIKEKNIVDVILENFQGTFGWVNNVGK